jgi:hypothetical protein
VARRLDDLEREAIRDEFVGGRSRDEIATASASASSRLTATSRNRSACSLHVSAYGLTSLDSRLRDRPERREPLLLVGRRVPQRLKQTLPLRFRQLPLERHDVEHAQLVLGPRLPGERDYLPGDSGAVNDADEEPLRSEFDVALAGKRPSHDQVVGLPQAPHPAQFAAPAASPRRSGRARHPHLLGKAARTDPMRHKTGSLLLRLRIPTVADPVAAAPRALDCQPLLHAGIFSPAHVRPLRDTEQQPQSPEFLGSSANRDPAVRFPSPQVEAE